MTKHFHGFCGQSSTVRFLKRQIAGAQADSKPCPHLLLTGVSGMGKTTLVKALAEEYGSDCVVVHGKAKPFDICESLSDLETGDFLLLDEAHSLDRDSQQLLYQVMDEGRAEDWSNGKIKAKRDKDGNILVANCCLVFASDRPGELLGPLKARLMQVWLEDYKEEELLEVCGNMASGLGLLLSQQATSKVVNASQGNPRKLKHCLAGMKRHYPDHTKRELKSNDVARYLRDANIDPMGVDAAQQRYLLELARRGTTALRVLCGLLGLDQEYVVTELEGPLLKMQLVSIGTAGRCLTPKGRKWVKGRDK